MIHERWPIEEHRLFPLICFDCRMTTEQGAPPKKFLVEPLSYKQTALNAIAPALALFVMSFGLPMGIKFSLDEENALATLTQGGMTLTKEGGWIVPLIITILLGFLAAVLAGNSLADAMEADRLRRNIGGAGLLLGTAGIVVVVYMGIYAATSKHWALMFGLIPAVITIVLIALHTGRYVAFSDDEKLSELDAVMNMRETRMSSLKERSVGSWRAPIIGNALAIATAGGITAIVLHPEHDLPRSFVALIVAFVACALVLLSAWYVLVSVYNDMTRTKFMIWLPPLFLYLLVAGSITYSLFLDDKPWAGVAGIVISVGSLAVSLFPRTRQSQRLLNWTVNGLAASTAFRILEKRQAEDSARRGDLQARIRESDLGNGDEQQIASLRLWLTASN
jgi:hypothetical protein